MPMQCITQGGQQGFRESLSMCQWPISQGKGMVKRVHNTEASWTCVTPLSYLTCRPCRGAHRGRDRSSLNKEIKNKSGRITCHQ
jgi:hypothetical protein